MSLTTITVIYGSSGLVNPDGSAATGTITMQPVQETPDAGYTIVASPRIFTLVAGQIDPAHNTIDTNGQADLQAMVYEQIAGAHNPPPYVVTIPTSGTLDLSQVGRGTVTGPLPLYVPESAVGQPNGVATLGSDGILAVAQRPAAGAGTVTSVTAADGTIVVGGTPAIAPTVRVGAIAEAQVTGLVTDLAAKVPAATVTTKGDLLAATGNAVVARQGVGSDGQVLTADSTQTNGVKWATPSVYKPTVRSGYVTSGSVVPPNTSGLWQALSGFEIDIPAAVGDWVELAYNGMQQDSTGTFYDIGVLVSTSIVRWLGTGGGTPLPGSFQGDPAWYPIGGFIGHSGPRGFTVTSNDLDGGSVRFAVVVMSNNTGKLFAEPSYPFYWQATNLGAHN